MTLPSLPERCDYLVIGAGATGMAFCDTLLHHAPDDSAPGSSSGGGGPSVVLVDDHDAPGGQWHDSYEFVRLHQPSDMYGVESERMEPTADKTEAGGDNDRHRATREEVLSYYDEVGRKLGAEFDFHFCGGVRFDLAQVEEAEAAGDDEGGRAYRVGDRTVRARKVVDARYLEPDLPVFVGPRFAYDPATVRCVPVNGLATAGDASEASDGEQRRHYVVIGAGKTGMDAIVHLLEVKRVAPGSIMWVVPHEAWITARENIGSCVEFLHTCTELLKREGPREEGRKEAVASTDFFQRGFLEWERRGKVYRFDENILPTKFKDATLSKEELALIKKVKRVVRNGRVERIDTDGTLCFEDGSTVSLPWAASGDGSEGGVGTTTYVHCSAGAFNYSKHTKKPPPIFGPNLISLQDVYGTPGFCFVGSVLGKLEALGIKLSDEEKNAMCRCPVPDPAQAESPLGPSGGDVGTISSDHGYVQRLANLRDWLQVPEVRGWLEGHRLFNLRHCSADEMDELVAEAWEVLAECGVVA